MIGTTNGMDIGFSVSCYKKDLPFAKACIASIRYFAPDARILLIADGDFSCRDLERVYKVQVLRRSDVKNEGLREFSFGYGSTKMVACWEAPFEYVLHVDADAVLWGDIRKNLPVGNWDFVFNEPHEIIDAFIQRTQYFDPNRIFDYIPEFPWQGNPYFNSGVFCVRRGALDLPAYLDMLKLQRQQPELIMCGEQGILNLLVFRAMHEGRIIAKPAHLQTVVPVIPPAKLADNFKLREGKPLVEGRPTVIHWAGVKPWRWNRGCFSLPMDFFRNQAARELQPVLGSCPDLTMRLEEWQAQHYPAYRQRLGKFYRSLGKRAGASF